MSQTDLSRIWYSDGNRRLRLPGRILQELVAFEQQSDRNESGGILLGLAYKDHDEILGLGQPTKADKRGLLSFIRRKRPAQERIDKAWNESGGYLIYLGEWHTHPGNAPTPSDQDLNMILNAVKTTQMEIRHLYLIIAGTNNSIWIGRQGETGLRVLRAEHE